MLLAVIAAVVASSAHRIEHAADVVLEVVFITVASLTGLAVLGAAAYVTLRVHRSHARTRQAIARQAPAIQRGSQALSARPARAIETSHVIDGVVISDETRERR